MQSSGRFGSLLMDKKIYHGSSRIVRAPKFGAGRPNNDFGLGFYCAENPQYANEWAVSRDRNGFISIYTIDVDGLRIINLCGPQYNPLHWLSLLLNFREFDLSSDTAYRAREYISKYFSVDYQGCDCIVGWRADNRLFMYAQDFLDGKMSYECLRRALPDESNRQFVLKSNRAFDRISYVDHRTVSADGTFPIKVARELRAMQTLKPSAAGELFISDLIEQEVRPYDACLR